MRIGVAGLGKVGLPVALSLAVHGKHQVTGYDVSDIPAGILAGDMAPPREEGLEELLAADHRIVLAASPGGLVENSDLVIVAVPTPHSPGFGGEAPVTQPAEDFDYRYLLKSVAGICWAARKQDRKITVMVLSTVLPGTMARVRQIADDHVTAVYSPLFISLGTVIPDFEYPPFVLCGTESPEDAEPVREMYSALPGAAGAYFARASFGTAEIAKMIYNAWGAMRITFANMTAELCDRLGGDCDSVQMLLHFAPSAVRGGMPDGGPCRPRDLIALSWLARREGLSHDLFSDMAKARESHAAWLAGVMRRWMLETGLAPVILGIAYKPETDLPDGSPSLLVRHYLGDCILWEPGMPVPAEPSVYLAAVCYPETAAFPFAPGSVVIDPWGFIPARDGIRVIRPGRS